MLTKPNTCNGCPLRDKGLGFVPDKLVPHPKYIMQGEAPGKNEVAQAEPFVGQAGFVLKQWLMRVVPDIKIADERGQVSYANTLRCLPPEIQGRAYPRGEEKLQAEVHCRQYDNFGEAHTVVLFGESPQRCFFGEELEQEDATDRKLGHEVKGVMGRMGRVYEKDGRRWVFAPHPAFILRQPALVEAGQQSLRIAANTDKILDVAYTDWSKAIDELCG